MTTVVNFQPTGGGKAAINGDFAMTPDEVQRVTKVLRSGGIEVVEIHNHSLTSIGNAAGQPGCTGGLVP